MYLATFTIRAKYLTAVCIISFKILNTVPLHGCLLSLFVFFTIRKQHSGITKETMNSSLICYVAQDNQSRICNKMLIAFLGKQIRRNGIEIKRVSERARH